MSYLLRRYGWVFAIVVASSLIGCGGEGKDDKESETKTVSERILGKWSGEFQVDDDVIQDMVKSQNIPEEDVAEFRKSIEGAKQYFVFKEDGTGHEIRQDADDADEEAFFADLKWKVTSESGDKGEVWTQNQFEVVSNMSVDFQSDDVFTAKPLPSEDLQGEIPDITFLFRRVEQTPTKPANYGEKTQ